MALLIAEPGSLAHGRILPEISSKSWVSRTIPLKFARNFFLLNTIHVHEPYTRMFFIRNMRLKLRKI